MLALAAALREIITGLVAMAFLPFLGRALPLADDIRPHDIGIGGLALEDPEVAREAVHAGDEAFGDGGVVIGQVAAHEIGDQRRLLGREELAPDARGALRILLQEAL